MMNQINNPTSKELLYAAIEGKALERFPEIY
jgi:hypothetical protein